MKIFVALPSRPGDAVAMSTLVATHNHGMGSAVYDFRPKSCSLLTTNFNALWCEALNERSKGVTHFCMMHSDVSPEPGWLKILWDEFTRVKADILSCVIPLKDDRGISSTGILQPGTKRLRKFSIAECLKFPRTFDAAGAGYPGHCLLLNTGLWLCDMTKDWPEWMVFRQYDEIGREAQTGKFKPLAVSEDFLFSMDAHRLGLRTFATTAVKLTHHGVFEYPNSAPWGTRASEQEWATAVTIDPPRSWKIENGRTGNRNHGARQAGDSDRGTAPPVGATSRQL